MRNLLKINQASPFSSKNFAIMEIIYASHSFNITIIIIAIIIIIIIIAIIIIIIIIATIIIIIIIAIIIIIIIAIIIIIGCGFMSYVPAN
jgi:hypothetical protein